MATCGIITIGQAPRVDIGRAFEAVFAGSAHTFVQAGALDKFDPADIRQTEIGRIETEKTYVSLLRDGTSIEVDTFKIARLLQERVTEIENDVDVIVVLCTGVFPDLSSSKPLYFPDEILREVVASRGADIRVGLVVPLEVQIPMLGEKWSGFNHVGTVVASPYDDGDFHEAGRQLADLHPDVVVTDCMGYTREHAQILSAECGADILTPQTTVASYVRQVLDRS